MVAGLCRPLSDRAFERCFPVFPCLADPARRAALGLRVTLVMLHLIYAGIIFLFDGDLINKTKTEPWYTALYLLLWITTLVQYFVTACSSPGYVIDAMRATNERNVIFRKAPIASKQSASNGNGSLLVTVERESGTNAQGSNAISWTKLVMDMYPRGTTVRSCTCLYCHVEQPPRAKHCHDCERCILQFDHHCVWLGTCIGQGNHCRFWWYICEETALCLWTAILYITYLKGNITRAWWKDAIIIMLLIFLLISLIFLLLLLLFHSYLVLTNQTTYELVRRRRVSYLSGIPERVYPFSKGVCMNLYNFCCVRTNICTFEPLPTQLELEEKSRPYTFLDVLKCRCC
ncbi:hypothetical protein SLE2022_359360 [Rubroshorea leprosula]